MSVPTLDFESITLHQTAVDITKHVFTREVRSIPTNPELQIVSWESGDAISPPLTIRYDKGNESYKPKYTFEIAGDDAEALTIPGEVDVKLLLADDPHASYFFETFWNAYSKHSHMMCLRGIRLARQAALQRESGRSAAVVRGADSARDLSITDVSNNSHKGPMSSHPTVGALLSCFKKARGL